MDFEWDPEKEKSNYKKHGISFSEAQCVFENDWVETIDSRRNYAEVRYIVTSEVGQGTILVIVYTRRSGKIRIISARKANQRERKKYYANTKS